ncbi:hypothetical protein [Dankookia sp. P2]|uniref:hypothetical protein n=1 Tax=Dankookia sp. P2 TaxID=3423955 RepID=UPI003D674D97
MTMKTDWFELNQARLHLAPYTYPHFPIAVASATTPSGVLAAGKYGVGLLLARRRPARRQCQACGLLAAGRGRGGEARQAVQARRLAAGRQHALRRGGRARLPRDCSLAASGSRRCPTSRKPSAGRRCARRTRSATG